MRSLSQLFQFHFMILMVMFTPKMRVDTGFNGWLSLPPDLISQLKDYNKINEFSMGSS
jgi:predicted aspartyl protease